MGFFSNLIQDLMPAPNKNLDDPSGGGMSASDIAERDEHDARDRAMSKAKRIKYLGEALDDLDDDDDDDDD